MTDPKLYAACREKALKIITGQIPADWADRTWAWKFLSGQKRVEDTKPCDVEAQ